MATVTLTGLWVHDDRRPHLDYRRFDVIRGLSGSTDVPGSTMVTASGRILSRRRPGRTRPIQVEVRTEGSGLQWLRDRVGRRLLWRDYAGRVVWGIVWRVPETEIGQGYDLVDVRLEIEEVDAPWPVGPDD